MARERGRGSSLLPRLSSIRPDGTGRDGQRSPAPPFPTFADALRVRLHVGLLSFGGPAAQIAVMHREVVDDRHWVSDARFLHALDFCMLVPGPEATRPATYLGWLMHGVKGGVAAGLPFILPGAAVMLALSMLYATLGAVSVVAALFFGLKCAVLVVVVEAFLRVAKRALKGTSPWLLAAAFAAGGHGTAKDGPPALLDAVLAAEPDRIGRMSPAARRAGLVALAVWLWPVALLMGTPVWGDIAWFFTKMAVVTFGGAYAVLAYVAQEAVGHDRWLTAPEMLAGLGLAETTPGPLILVLQFVRFLAAYRDSGILGGIGGSLLTLWVTFAPCVAWIFLGAPFVERMHDQPRLRGALAGVTAAVVGLIASLAPWFGLRVFFAAVHRTPLGPAAIDVPAFATPQPGAVALALLAGGLLFGLRLGLGKTLAISALAGLAFSALPV